MSSKSDLALLADSIEKLAEELAGATSSEDRIEIEALLELARETHTIVKARLGKGHQDRARTRQSAFPTVVALPRVGVTARSAERFSGQS